MKAPLRDWWRRSGIGLALVLITLALYLPSLGHEFLLYDDQFYVTENPRVQAGLKMPGLAWAFGYHVGNWHPLTWLSHMLDCQCYALKPAGHHLTSVLLHVAVSVLLFLVLRRMTGAVVRSAFVAALFAWHPLRVESVAWVAERKDVLCAFFWMLTLLAYVRYTEASRAGSPKSGVWYGWALVSFALALMSKPMAVTLPFVLVLLDFWPLNRMRSEPGKSAGQTIPRLLLEKSPFLILAVVTSALTLAAQAPAMAPTAVLPISERLSHALVAYAHYLGALFVPRHMAVYYPYESATSGLQPVLAGILLFAITVLAVRMWSRFRGFLIGWLWFLGTLVPVIGVVQVGDQAWADRYTYLPTIGLLIPLVWSGAAVLKRPMLAVAVGSTAAVALLVATTVQLGHWKNTRTLFEHTAQVTRNNYLAVTLLGSLRAKEGKPEEAIEFYTRAMSYKPAYAEAWFFLGHARDQQGKLDEAIAAYQQALRLNPALEQAHIFLGVALARGNQADEAAAHYFAALKINPESALAHNNLARLRHTQGKLDAAVEHYSMALKLDPSLAPAHNNLGILLLQQGRLTEGTDQLREAWRLNPTDPETQVNLASALNERKQWGEAAEWFARAISSATTDPKAHYQFALALSHLRRTREAMSHYASALLLSPDFPDALDGLAWILATDPNPEFRNAAEAVRMAERAVELSGRKEAGKLKTLAAAYAEAGRFPEAISTAQAALGTAAPAGRSEAVKELELMLVNFKAAKPWRAMTP